MLVVNVLLPTPQVPNICNIDSQAAKHDRANPTPANTPFRGVVRLLDRQATPEQKLDKHNTSLSCLGFLGSKSLASSVRPSVRPSFCPCVCAYMAVFYGQVGWAYNLWGQVEFRQEELEFRFGPALGAAAYAALSTALGVCVMVRGADKLAGSSRRKNGGRTTAAAGGAINDNVGGALGSRPGGGYFHVERPEEDEEEMRQRDAAVRSYHARRLLVVVGGVSLVVGWAWEEAFDLALEGLLGDEADAATVAAKLSLAVAATAVVLGREVRRAGRRDAGGEDLHDHNGAGEGGGGLLEPLVPTTRDTAVL